LGFHPIIPFTLMSSPRKIYTGIGLDPEVIQFLGELARETERPRSWLINAIVREKARSLQEEHAAAADVASRQKPPVIRA